MGHYDNVPHCLLGGNRMHKKHLLASLSGTTKGKIRQLQLIGYLSLLLNAILIVGGLLLWIK